MLYIRVVYKFNISKGQLNFRAFVSKLLSFSAVSFSGLIENFVFFTKKFLADFMHNFRGLYDVQYIIDSIRKKIDGECVQGNEQMA